MNLSSLVTNNITEILVKIIQFTQIRQEIISENINNIDACGFVPKDLEVNRFSELMNTAVCGHVQSGRLMLCDTENIKFGARGHFEVKPIADTDAREALGESRDGYLELQIQKLLENTLNQRVAAELLKQMQERSSSLE